MFNNENGSSMSAFMCGVGVGAVIGAAAGLLLAPRSGEETREKIGEKIGDVKEKVTGWVKDKRNLGADKLDDLADKVGA